MDRHVIANMGAELGATASVFPADFAIKQFLETQGRSQDWLALSADQGATYDEYTEIDLSSLEPLIACPSSPGNVVPVREVAGKDIYQVMVGSSANPGLRDFAIAAEIVADKTIHSRVSFDINPTSRQVLENLIQLGYLQKLIHAGGRIHQAGCNGCIGMGQAPATNRISLRTVPRNFPGRSGTKEDQVYLCSPETAAASALTGVITDPRSLAKPYPRLKKPKKLILNTSMLLAPATLNKVVDLEKGPNIKPLPTFPALSDTLSGPVLLKVADNISTDSILPAGTKVLPFRSNIPGISQFVFTQIDETYPQRALAHQQTGSFIVGGQNYGQGSSREHAAIAPRYLGVIAVIAKSFARIHAQNLVNFGILPLTFSDPQTWEHIQQGDSLEITKVRTSLQQGQTLQVINVTQQHTYAVQHHLSTREISIILAGGLINYVKQS